MRLGELYHFLRFSISKTCGNNIEAFPGGSQESFLRALCALSVTLFFKTCIKAYRAVAERRSAYAAMVRLGTPNFSSACFRKVKDGFSQRTHRTQWKHKPGVDSRKHISSLCPLCPPCEPRLIFKTCQLKSWRSQAYRAVAKRRSAYAAMLRSRTLPEIR